MAQIVNKFLAQMSTLTLKGNNTGGTANPSDLTVAQVNAILPVFTSTLNGLTPLSGGGSTNFLRADGTWAAPSGTGSVTSVSVVSTNGFAGTVATATSTPAITIETTITGIIKGNGTAISAATAGTDYVIPSGSITGTSGNVTATSNATLATLSALTTATSLASVGTITTGTWNGTTIAIANGGTGQTTAAAAYNALSPMTTTGDIEYESGTNTAARLPIGSPNQVLTVIGGIPSWQTPSAGGITQLTGDVTAGPGSGSQAATLATVNTNTGSFGSSTSIPTFTVNGKGLITAASGNVVVAPAGTLSGTTLNSTVVTSSLTSLGAQSQALNMNSNQINNLANGVAASDAANYGQVLAIAAGLSWKTAVLIATTANITLSGEQTIDGFLTSASRVLVKNQSTAANNGIYVSGTGAWTRSTDMNTWAQVPAATVTVQEGTVNADLGFICNAAPGGTLGTTAINFVDFGTYFADGSTLQLVGSTFSVKNAGITQTQIASTSFSATGAITGGSGTTIAVSVDGATVKVNGSNQLEALQPNEEQITLSGTNITNQYVDLAYAVFGTSASVNSIGVYVVGGPQQQKTVDYTVSLTGGAGGVTRVSFAGGLATGGNSALVSGDILVVDYDYLA